MAEQFTIKIPCKKYVKAYLESNCGKPINLKHLPEFNEDFRKMLSKETYKDETYPNTFFTDTMEIVITSDWFFRYGFSMSKRNILDFNIKVEHRIKATMRNFVLLNSSLGYPIAQCIREFQDRFNLPEPVWSFESIKKEYDRNGTKVKIKTIKVLREELNKILVNDLTNSGSLNEDYFQKLK